MVVKLPGRGNFTATTIKINKKNIKEGSGVGREEENGVKPL